MKQPNALKDRDSFTSFTADMLIAMLAPCLIAVLSFGWTAVRLLLACSLSALLCQGVCAAIAGKKEETGLLSALLTGMTLGLLLPAGFSLWKGAVGAAFAVVVICFPFGGAKHTPFSPTAAGFVFLCLSYPKDVFRYAAPETLLNDALAPASSASLAAMLKVGESVTPNYLTYLNIVIGNVPAAMGTACLAVLCGVSLYLLIRRPDVWITGAAFVTVCALIAVLFPRVLTGRKASLFMELAAGSLVFAAFLLLPQGSAGPKTPGKRMLFGGLAGALCMLLRRFGAYEEGACAAILLADCIWPALDSTLSRRLTLKKKEVSVNVPG